MVYVENTSHYRQKVYIPKDEASTSTTHTYQFQNKDYDINHNGEYYIEPDPGYDGISAGTITVHVPTDTQEAYDEGYADGYSSGVTDGEQTQKSKLEPLTATTNGHYVREDGYSEVFVEVETGGDYQQGYQDGEAAQKAKLEAFTATTNGHYTREDGWNDLVVEVPQTGSTAVLVPLTASTNDTYYPAAYSADGFSEVAVHVDTQPYYDQGYQDGQAAQRALLGTLSADTNGTYTSETGYSAVTVNVPITGETYPRSNVTVGINSDDYEGLSGMTVQFNAWGQPYSSFTPTSAVTASTAVYNPGVEFSIEFEVPDGYHCDQGKIIYYSYYTLWGRNNYSEYALYRYEGVNSEITVYTRNGASSVFSSNDMMGMLYDGSANTISGPSASTYDQSEDKWTLQYEGALVSGFTFVSGSTLKNDITRIEVPYDVSRIDHLDGLVNLESFYGEGITHVGYGMGAFDDTAAFQGCTALTSFTTSIGVRSIGARAFQDCTALTNTFSLANVTEIGHSAFLNCWSLDGMIELNSITTIGYQAFMNCTSITQAYIGANCTNVDSYAFSGCSSLNWIWIFATTAPTLGVANPFSGVASEGTLFVPSGADYSSWMAKLPSGWTISYFS